MSADVVYVLHRLKLGLSVLPSDQLSGLFELMLRRSPSKLASAFGDEQIAAITGSSDSIPVAGATSETIEKAVPESATFHTGQPGSRKARSIRDLASAERAGKT